jgi:hypothetical protein
MQDIIREEKRTEEICVCSVGVCVCFDTFHHTVNTNFLIVTTLHTHTHTHTHIHTHTYTYTQTYLHTS